MKCPKCGSPIKENARFCGKCGQPVAHVRQTQNQQNDVNTLRRQSERPQNRSGKYSAAQPTRRAKKKKSGGTWIIGLLIALIVALSCVVVFVIRPMLKNAFSAKEAMEAPQYSTQEQNTNNDKKEDKDGNGFLGLGGNKQVIYVVDGKSTYYPSDEGLSNVQTYEFSEDGFPLVYHYGYYNNFYPASTGYFAYDDTGFTEELVNFIIETADLSESERNKQGEKFEKKRDKILKEYGINAEDSYGILGLTDNLVTASYGGSTNSVTKYNSRGKRIEHKTYWGGNLYTTQIHTYIADTKLLTYELHNENSGITSRMVYTYESGDNPVSAEFSTIENNTMSVTGYSYYTYDNNGNMSSSKDSDGNYTEYTYDENGIILFTNPTDGVKIENTYHYKKIEVAEDKVDLLCNIYDYLGITYVLGGDGITVTNTLDEETMAIASAEPIEWMGSYSKSSIQGDSNFYVKYPDGSFDKYYRGSPLIWEGPDPMTYGADYTPEHVIMSNYDVRINADNLKNGELVLVCPNDNRVRAGVVPVQYSGMTMTRTNEDGKKEAVFLSKMADGDLQARLWVRGKSISYGYPCNTINGIGINEYGKNFEYIQRYQSLPENEKYTLGVVSGAALVETEFQVDSTYFIQQEVEPYELKLIPTVDGYATIDFSEIPAGEYVLYYSYWNEGRTVMTTYVTVD